MKLECYAIGPNPPSLIAARPDRAWMDEFPARHAYRCLPMAIANTHGWEMLSPSSFSIHWNGGPEAADIHFEPHDDYPHLSHIVMSNFSRGIVTFHTGYIFRTDPGWNLLATGSFNQPKDGISPLTGVVETSWLPYPFTMNWQLTRPGVVRFEKGEPICLVFPVPAQALETVHPTIHALESNSELAGQHAAWREKREQFMINFRAGDPATLKEAWQKFYFKGELPNSDADAQDQVQQHVQKLRLAAPRDMRPPAPEKHAAANQPPRVLPSPHIAAAGNSHRATAPALVSRPTTSTRNGALAMATSGAPQAVLPAAAAQRDASKEILQIANFLSAADCAELIAAFERCQSQLGAAPGRSDGFFDNRFLWINSLPTETERSAKRLMQATRFRCIEAIKQFYGEPELYSDTIQLVKWSQGMSMPVHSDNSNPDNSHHPTAYRKYATVIYLNDDYQGGELFIPPLGLELKPRAGMLVGFRGGVTHAHGVRRVTQGTRYTMPGWYTDDPTHNDPYASEVY